MKVFTLLMQSRPIESIEAALHGKSVNMIETVSSWILPETSEYRREPARPGERRQANFDALFDWHTVNLCRIRIEVSEGDTCLRFQTIAGSKILDIRPDARQVFRGRRVLFT